MTHGRRSSAPNAFFLKHNSSAQITIPALDRSKRNLSESHLDCSRGFALAVASCRTTSSNTSPRTRLQDPANQMAEPGSTPRASNACEMDTALGSARRKPQLPTFLAEPGSTPRASNACERDTALGSARRKPQLPTWKRKVHGCQVSSLDHESQVSALDHESQDAAPDHILHFWDAYSCNDSMPSAPQHIEEFWHEHCHASGEYLSRANSLGSLSVKGRWNEPYGQDYFDLDKFLGVSGDIVPQAAPIQPVEQHAEIDAKLHSEEIPRTQRSVLLRHSEQEVFDDAGGPGKTTTLVSMNNLLLYSPAALATL